MGNKKGQVSGGLITGLVFGVASLVIGVIIAFVIVSTLADADLLSGSRDSMTITNETATGGINNTGYTVDGSTGIYVPGTFSVSEIRNGTAGNGTVWSSTLYTISNDGTITNVTVAELENAEIDYTYSNYTSEEVSSSSMRANFTEGIDNVSSKLPTVLLVAAIVLILGVLAILVGVWQRMRMGGGTTL